MRADLGALLDHHHGNIGIDLLEADGRGQARRPGADNHHVEFHRFASGKVLAGRQVSHEGLLASDIPLLHSGGNRAACHARLQE